MKLAETITKEMFDTYPELWLYAKESDFKAIIQKHLATLGPPITEYGVASWQDARYSDDEAFNRVKLAKAGLDALLKGD